METTIIRLAETKSTNAYACGILSNSSPKEGCVIVADYQTEGKGTDANIWESEMGKNLTFSLIFYPKFDADQQFIMNKAISLGICDFLKSEIPGNKISIKWPNDLYIENKKVCGILIQNSVMGNKLVYTVVGIGLNVNQILFTSSAPNPISLKLVTGREYNLDELLMKLVNTIFNRYYCISHHTIRKIENEYHRNLYRLLEWHEYMVKGARVHAMIKGTNTYGQLLLEKETGEVLVCDLKEVKFII